MASVRRTYALQSILHTAAEEESRVRDENRGRNKIELQWHLI